MRKPTQAACFAAASIAVIALSARGDQSRLLRDWPKHELEFARLFYDDYGRGWRGGSWRVDWPEAEFFFSKGVGRLTRVDIDRDSRLGETGVIVRLEDDAIFHYPWLYAVEVGYWRLSDYEAGRLREYLLRGGFLIVDDFHGTQQWIGFTDSMNRVFPDRPIVEIPDGDPLLDIVYDVSERIQIPGIVSIMNNTTYELDGITPHWRGIYDDEGRLMVAINFNMDMGDAWEHADDPVYPQPMTALALRFAVNYVIYAMTH